MVELKRAPAPAPARVHVERTLRCKICSSDNVEGNARKYECLSCGHVHPRRQEQSGIDGFDVMFDISEAILLMRRAGAMKLMHNRTTLGDDLIACAARLEQRLNNK
jgi:hypothetical protein